MARIRIEVDASAIEDILTSQKAYDVVAAEAERIADACNAQSEWGGYHASDGSGPSRARARVHSADNRNDEFRDQRMLRNL